MNKVPLIDFSEQYQNIQKELRAAVEEVFSSQQFILNKGVRKLEAALAERVGVGHAVGVSSGSDALYLSLLSLGIGPADEVITTPFTFFATAGAISRTGAKPVFVDIDPATFNVDPARLEEAVTKSTKAIIPVHLFGLSCDMQRIMEIARRHSLKVIEDACQSFGAKYFGRETGALGDIGCYSFFPTKNLGGAGDGGMVVTSKDEWADKVRLLRVHGSRKKYFHEMIGINSRLDELQAAVVGVKLKYVTAWNALRREHAQDYDRRLSGLPVVRPIEPEGHMHIYHLYSILTPRRDELAAFLSREGIGCGVYYPLPLHLQPCYKDLGYRAGDFPVCERVSKEILSLPMFPELRDDQKTSVVDSVKKFFA